MTVVAGVWLTVQPMCQAVLQSALIRAKLLPAVLHRLKGITAAASLMIQWPNAVKTALVPEGLTGMAANAWQAVLTILLT